MIFGSLFSTLQCQSNEGSAIACMFGCVIVLTVVMGLVAFIVGIVLSGT